MKTVLSCTITEAKAKDEHAEYTGMRWEIQSQLELKALVQNPMLTICFAKAQQVRIRERMKLWLVSTDSIDLGNTL